MIKAISLVLVFFSLSLEAQTDSIFLEKFLQGINYKKINLVDSLSKYDFSELWYKENTPVYGTIGNNQKRLYVKIISVVKNQIDPKEYFVYGKRKFNDSIKSFQGTLKIKSMYPIINPEMGLEGQFKNKGIKLQAFIISDFIAYDEKLASQNTELKGEFYSKFYLNSENQIEYNLIDFSRGGYFNNAFVGNIFHNSKKDGLLVKWADFIPIGFEDFDQSELIFRPDPKYKNKGWSDLFPDPKNKGGIQMSYDDDWWKL